MIKIVGKKVIDLIAYQQGILFVLKEQTPDGQYKASFYSFDAKSKSIATVTKNAYLMTKFGPSFAKITECLDDYISCEAQRLKDGRVCIVYPGGEIGIFADDGELLHTERLQYNGNAVRSLAYDGTYLWFAVPDANAVVRYHCDKYRIDMRLGNTENTSFATPFCVFATKDSLFVCSKTSKCVLAVSLQDFSITPYQAFEEAVLQYLQINEDCFVVLPSGIYLLQ